MIRKKFSLLFLLFSLSVLIFFALQPKDTNLQLSLTALNWLSKCGLSISLAELRTVVHIPEYFFIGLAVFLFGKERDWPLWKIITVAVLIAISEETTKHFLPERDFDFKDIVVDCVGIGISLGLCGLLTRN